LRLLEDKHPGRKSALSVGAWSIDTKVEANETAAESRTGGIGINRSHGGDTQASSAHTQRSQQAAIARVCFHSSDCRGRDRPEREVLCPLLQFLSSPRGQFGLASRALATRGTVERSPMRVRHSKVNFFHLKPQRFSVVVPNVPGSEAGSSPTKGSPCNRAGAPSHFPRTAVWLGTCVIATEQGAV
jgi:hypothetical protein